MLLGRVRGSRQLHGLAVTGAGPGWVAVHPLAAARRAWSRCGHSGQAGWIRGTTTPQMWGSEQLPSARLGCVDGSCDDLLAADQAGQAADVPVTQPVKIRVRILRAAATLPIFFPRRAAMRSRSSRALGGERQALDGLDGGPAHHPRSLLGDVALVHDVVGLAVAGRQPGRAAQLLRPWETGNVADLSDQHGGQVGPAPGIAWIARYPRSPPRRAWITAATGQPRRRRRQSSRAARSRAAGRPAPAGWSQARGRALLGYAARSYKREPERVR